MIADCVVSLKKIGAICCVPRWARNQLGYWFVELFSKLLTSSFNDQAFCFLRKSAMQIVFSPKNCVKFFHQPSSRSFQQFQTPSLPSVHMYLIHKLNTYANTNLLFVVLKIYRAHSWIMYVKLCTFRRLALVMQCYCLVPYALYLTIKRCNRATRGIKSWCTVEKIIESHCRSSSE